MGRPSLVATRTEQLLAAVEAVILRDGVAGMTIAAVARESGLLPSHVHHYLGSREQALSAAVDRAIDRIEQLLAQAARAAPSDGELDAQLDALFSPAVDDPGIELMLEHLVVATHHDAHVRTRMTAVYQHFVATLTASLADAAPQVPVERRAEVATAILALADAAPSMVRLAAHPSARAHLRSAAAVLVADLTRPQP